MTTVTARLSAALKTANITINQAYRNILAKMKNNWIDVSVGLSPGTVTWPGDNPVSITRVSDMMKGGENNLSALTLGAHAGTHVDAPLHFLAKGATVDMMGLDVFIGETRVIEIKDAVSIKEKELRVQGLKQGERILFKTVNSIRCWKQNKFVEDYVYIENDAAGYIVSSGARAVGIDYLSVGGYGKNGPEVHRILLEGGIALIEGLDLSGVTAGVYEMVCLPLKLIDAEGAPARVILRKI